MPLRAHGPEPCVSANSTTPAIDCNTLLNSVGKSQFNDKYVQGTGRDCGKHDQKCSTER